MGRGWNCGRFDIVLGDPYYLDYDEIFGIRRSLGTAYTIRLIIFQLAQSKTVTLSAKFEGAPQKL